ncbi:MAG TPA: hypothetical protein VMH26_07570 [Burkholderiales bacterium]|nr:hypothetical protein [Burkholderiales bacterium]
MTTKTVTHLIIAAALAASAAAGLQLTPSLASAPVMSALPVKAEAGPSGGALFFLLSPAANRFAPGYAGLTPARAPVLRIAQ